MMEALDPIALSVAAVAVAAGLSGLLFLLFATREESFESSQAAQRVEQEALLLSKHSSGKGQKQKKKQGKGKKKAIEHDSEGEPAEYEKEDIKVTFDTSQVEIEPALEQAQNQPKENKTTAKEEKPKSVAKEKEGKKKGKKAVHRDDLDWSETAHDNRGGQSRKQKDQTVIEEVFQQLDSQVVNEAIPEVEVVKEEILMTENEPLVSSEPLHPGKKTKNKLKATKGKEKPQSVVPDINVNVKHLLESLRSAALQPHEVQQLIDVLLDRQAESTQWKKSAAKGDSVEILRKQLTEKEGVIAEERLLAQSATNKLKEVRDELQQEKQKLKHQNMHATNKIQAQAQEIQALQARIQNTHETHSRETQNLQARLHQMEQIVESSSMPNIQQLQQENAQLKNSQMRAAQLVADKDALTNELNKVQQANRQVTNELKKSLEVLKQREAHQNTLEDKLRQQQNNKEAEIVLSKRLGEVSEELKKSEARCSNISGDLEKAKATLNSEEAKTAQLSEQIKQYESCATDHATTMKTLSERLKQATDKVERMEVQLPEIQQEQESLHQKLVEKEAELEQVREELSKRAADASEKNETILNHTESDAEGQKEPVVTMETHQTLLKEKEDIIARLGEDVNKKDEEIKNLKNSSEQLKAKNNELRQKNWKAMEAVTAAEQNVQSLVSKALQSAKEEKDALSTLSDAKSKEMDDMIAKLSEDLKTKAEEIQSLEKVLTQQKQKNNELREKNWKAMDAVSEAEKSVKTQISKAVQAAKQEAKSSMDERIAKTKEILCKAHDGICISDSLPYEQWLMQFIERLSELHSSNKQDEAIKDKLQEAEHSYKQLAEECDHYRNGLETTEAMLKTLESNIESEIQEWQSKVEEREGEIKQLREKNESLEEQLLKNRSSENLYSAKISSLEEELQQARAAEIEAKEKAAAFFEELSAVSKKTDEESLQKLEHLEKELAKVKTLENNLADKMTKLESKDKEITVTKKQLEAEKQQAAQREKRIDSLREELEKFKNTDTELKKKISSLEDAVTKANNLTQSAESLDSVSNNPEKKKKGLKGALNKVMGSSKKDKDKNSDKEKASSQLEELQRQIATYKAQIEELTASKTTLENKNQTLEDEKTDLQKRLSTSLDADKSPESKSPHIEKAVAEAIADTTNSPVKSRTPLAKHLPGGSASSSGSAV